MAAKQEYETQEIPKLERVRHQGYSMAAAEELEYFTLADETTRLLDNSGMTLDGFDLTKMFDDYDPEQLMQVIGKHGVMLLGDMKIADWLVRREFKGRTTLTIGLEEMHLTDWEKIWMDNLTGEGKKLEGDLDANLVKVEAFVVTIRNAAGVRQNGLLHRLIKRWDQDECPIEVWGLAPVRALVSYKWNHWARKYLTVQFVVYLLWVFSFVSLAVTFRTSDLQKDAKELWDEGPWMQWGVFHVILTQLFMFPFTYLCIRRIGAGAWLWTNFWNIIDILTQMIQVICTIVYLMDACPKHFDILLAVQTILLVAKIQFFARAFVAVDSSMLDTLKAVAMAIRWYLLLLVLTVYSFACAFYILFRRERYRHCTDFSSIVRSVMTMFGLMLGEWEMDNYLSTNGPFNETAFNASYPNWPPSNLSHYHDALEKEKSNHEWNSCYWGFSCKVDSPGGECPESAWGKDHLTLDSFSIMIFFCIYMLITSVLLYHLLIAMIIDIHSRQMEVKKLWVHLSRAEIINILENGLPVSMTQQFASPYIHVLRVIPTRNANPDKVWHQLTLAESSARRHAEEFEHHLDVIQADILSRIEGISDRIRLTVGIPEEEYRNLVYRKRGIQQVMAMAKRPSFRKGASSKKLLGS